MQGGALSPPRLEVLYEDADLIAIFKPAGLNSQPSVDRKKHNVFDLLTASHKEVYLHHRLDKDTSGVMILSKSKRANKPMGEMFQEHRFTRTYLALCKGNQLPGSWDVENYLRSYKHKGQLKQQVRKSGGDYAKTHFRLLDSFQECALVEAQPHTGRMHQIRIHLAAPGNPILGDVLYGGKSTLVPRLMLHALRMEFKHPVTGQDVSIEAPLAKDFETILEKLKTTQSLTGR